MGGSVSGQMFSNRCGVHHRCTVATVEPGIGRDELQHVLRRSTRLGAFAAYVVALAVGLVAVRPAFQHQPPAAPPAKPQAAPRTDELRKGESVATFAARHGLDLGELLALNPRINSLRLPPGTRLRIG
jgi:hypothetical protein